MSRSILVTGGAGFVGSHLVDALVERGDRVRVLDDLDAQVHGPARRVPEWLPDGVELVRADVRDRKICEVVLAADTVGRRAIGGGSCGEHRVR